MQTADVCDNWLSDVCWACNCAGRAGTTQPSHHVDTAVLVLVLVLLGAAVPHSPKSVTTAISSNGL